MCMLSYNIIPDGDVENNTDVTQEEYNEEEGVAVEGEAVALLAQRALDIDDFDEERDETHQEFRDRIQHQVFEEMVSNRVHATGPSGEILPLSSIILCNQIFTLLPT